MNVQTGTITTIIGAIVGVLTAVASVPELAPYSAIIHAVAGLLGSLALFWAKDPKKVDPPKL